jgi:hypothetical protein
MQKTSIFLCSFIIAYLIWPYMALLKLYVGLKSSNIEIVQEEINWSPFRKNIEENLNHYAKELINRNFKRQNMRISFSSTSLARQIAGDIATPEGMIFLFHKPKNYVDQIREIINKASDPKHKKASDPKHKKASGLNKLSPPVEKKPIKLEGPNIAMLRERIDYLFFTDFSHFEASFKVKKIPFIMKWERRRFDWKLKTLGFSLASPN